MTQKILIILFCCYSLIATAHEQGSKGAAVSVTYASLVSKDGHITIYPNPATDRIYIHGDPQQAYGIELMNMLGEVVLSEDIINGTVSVEGLEPGIYIIRIYGTDGQVSFSSKLTKQ
jgi:hypothetical protein